MLLYLVDKNGLDEVNIKEVKDGIYILDENKSGKDKLLEDELYNFIKDTENIANRYIFGTDKLKVINMWNNYVEAVKDLGKCFEGFAKGLDNDNSVFDIVIIVFSLLLAIGIFSTIIL